MEESDSSRNESESQQEAQNGRYEKSLPKSAPTALVLRLTADMFRQHSQLFLKQAAILERVATNPTNPASWNLEEESVEATQDKFHQEDAVTLAIKSYQSMLHVQKRVEFMEQLMIKNNVSKVEVHAKANAESQKRPPDESVSVGQTEPFYWFRELHAERVIRELGDENNSKWSYPVRMQLKKVWNTCNPAQRQPFIDKAEEIKLKIQEQPELLQHGTKKRRSSRKIAMTKKKTKKKASSVMEEHDQTAEAARKDDDDEEEGGGEEDSSDSSSSSDEEPKLLFSKANDSEDE